MLGISALSNQSSINPYQFTAPAADVAPLPMARPGAARDANANATQKTEGCQTCKNRKYQDGSNDPGVSFKTPTHISPEQSGAAVRAHENEHVNREQAKAEQEGREVVTQSVQIHTSVCPDCGKPYVSGGTTTTTTREKEKLPSAAEPSGEPGQLIDRYR